VQEELDMGRMQTTAAGLAITAAWRTMMPCNWLGQQVPQGTPGSWG
jgi:hypothetical protein